MNYRTVGHYYILVIRKFIDFMSLFRHSVWFSFSVKQFPSAEFGICNIQLRIADKNRRRVELSSSVLLQTLAKLRPLQGTDLSVASSCDLFIRIVLNFNFEFKVLTDRNKQSEMLWGVDVYSGMICAAKSSYLLRCLGYTYFR